MIITPLNSFFPINVQDILYFKNATHNSIFALKKLPNIEIGICG